MLYYVSIHAPTWGATYYLRLLNFHFVFQSTHPRGVRPTLLGQGFQGVCFNPRTHVGCDTGTLEEAIARFEVSIHAPTWGATCQHVADIYAYEVFQSTHPRGVRLQRRTTTVIIQVSIHAPTWGATHWLDGLTEATLFQSTHPRGVRLIFSKYLNIILQKYINCEQHANF